MTVKGIALRDEEAIANEIAALETECEADAACGKKTYAANCIRLDIARLRQDVHILAIGLQEMGEFFRKLDIVINEQVRLADAQDVMQACLANNVRVLRKLVESDPQGQAPKKKP